MRRLVLLTFLAPLWFACAANPHPDAAKSAPAAAGRLARHVLDRIAYGPRPGDVDRVRAMGVSAYIEQQLHPERLHDTALEARAASLTALAVTPARFATEYYQPMAVARQEYVATQKPAGRPLPYLRWHALPIAAVTMPGGPRPVAIIGQSPVTPEELRYQRANQRVLDDLQAYKLLDAVYSERQLQSVLTDFWFNHFNVDARKIEDKPVLVAYERDVIRPRVLGRFRDLLEADARSAAMLFYLDNWLSRARAINENYARELMELHTLGVDGGYTQADVMEVARCFTGWTMRSPHDGGGFFFDPKKHDRDAKRVLGHRIKAGGGIEDGEQVLDILARHPSTARFIATKLVRRFVADDPPPRLVERAAKAFRRTDGDLREVVRVILTSREFSSDAAYGAKLKSPFEYVVSALRATGADVTNPRPLAGTIAAMGEPLYQCQPPTGYPDRAQTWLSTGTLVTRLNFAFALASNGAGAVKVAPGHPQADVRATAMMLGSPEFQRR